jgi:lysophospholipase L1-like esterase
MDACLMAAQLLAHCMGGGPNPAEPNLNQGDPWVAATPTPAMPLPARATTAPETLTPETLAPETLTPETLTPETLNSDLPPETRDGATCVDWGMPTKPKNGEDTRACTALSWTVPPQSEAGYPLSLPLHAGTVIRSGPSAAGPMTAGPSETLGAPATGVTATLTPPPQTLPSPSTMAERSPQVSRVLHPQAASQPYWASQPRPVSGGQMYQFRLAALRAGSLYTRTAPQNYIHQWQAPGPSPTHHQWQVLLQQEAGAMAGGQGHNRLTVVVGDSLALWLPSETLPRDRFWLNQSISGETTAQMLGRLHYFANTRPDTIHVMAGINDLKNGATDAEVTRNLHQMLTQLRQQHPQAKLIVHSILPTRWGNLPSDRIARVNHHLAYLARQQGATFVDLQPSFADAQGQLRRELTTDGLHLSPQGYETWQATLFQY